MISGFRSVSILNCFKNFYENAIKNAIKSELVKCVNVHLLLYQHIERITIRFLIRITISLKSTGREQLDNNKTVGGILMEISKGFDCVPHDL